MVRLPCARRQLAVHGALKEIGPITWRGWRRIEVTAPETWQHYLGNNDGIFDVPVRQCVIQLDAVAGAPSSGALYVDDLTLSFDGGDRVVADFELPQRNIRVWMLGEPDTTVVVANGLGPDLTKPVPLVMARRFGKRTRFVSLLEPFTDAPSVVTFDAASDGTIRIDAVSFSDTFRLTATGVENFRRVIK